MSAGNKLYITISDKRLGDNDSDTKPKKTPKEGKESELEKFAHHKLMHFVENEANAAIQFSIGNIGNFTGNYVEQRNQSYALEKVMDVINIGTVAFAGLSATGGNPVGALLGVGIALTGQTLSFGRNYITGLVQNRKQNYSIEQLRIRSGLDTIDNGNRGTEN